MSYCIDFRTHRSPPQYPLNCRIRLSNFLCNDVGKSAAQDECRWPSLRNLLMKRVMRAPRRADYLSQVFLMDVVMCQDFPDTACPDTKDDVLHRSCTPRKFSASQRCRLAATERGTLIQINYKCRDIDLSA